MWRTLLLVALTFQTPPASPQRPLQSSDEVGVELVFSYEESHEKALGKDASMQFRSRRQGVVHAKLKRYRAYAGVDSFRYRGPGTGVLSIADEIVWRTGGGDVTERESGSGAPSEVTLTLHLDGPRNVYSFALDIDTPTEVVRTGPLGTTNDPNAAGLSWSSPEFPLTRGVASLSDTTTFSPPLGSAQLGTNVVAMGRTFKSTDGVPLEPVRLNWLIERPGPKPEVELTYDIEDYGRWLPRGPRPSDGAGVHGNEARIVATLARKDGQPMERGALFVRFELAQSSREPGVCLNVPREWDGELTPDLAFVAGADAAPHGPDGEVAETPFGDWRTATAALGAFDWGAYGELEVRAYVPHIGEVLGTFAPTGERSARVPKRAADSLVGDEWKARHGVTDLADDDDSERTEGNPNDGDGFTLYEEYRGVFARGEHSRDRLKSALVPRKKDLVALIGQEPRAATHPTTGDLLTFTPLGATEVGQLDGGFQLFESATLGARIVAMEEREAHPTREINVNGLSHKAGPQFGVLLLRAPASAPSVDGALEVGGAYPLDRYPKTPETTDWIVYDFEGLAAGFAGQSSASAAAGVPMPYTLAEEVANTVAHELVHACGVNHHGDVETRGPTRRPKELPAGTYRVLGHDGVELAPDEVPDVIQGSIAPSFSRACGDPRCIMAYNNAYSWRLTSGGGYTWRAVLPGPMGSTLCTGKDGDPPNELFGPASPLGGNCRQKFKVRCH